MHSESYCVCVCVCVGGGGGGWVHDYSCASGYEAAYEQYQQLESYKC